METENRKSKTLVGVSKEVDATEESMEYWFNRGVSDVEEGEVVRGRVVEVRDSEILVDIGYKSEGTIPIEEFRHAGILPKVGEEIEVYLESKEDNEGLIVLSKDKADKIKVWDQIGKAHDSGTPVEGRVAEVLRPGQIWADMTTGDPGETPLRGGLLVARYGKGYFVYTGLAWFRQLPEGVPGAYRVFANLVSLGK